MKIWRQYGSEHSANLVMIGHFVDAAKAMKAAEAIDAIKIQVGRDQSDATLAMGKSSDRYSKEMLDLLLRLRVSSIAPMEFEQFAFYVGVKVDGSQLVLTTEELDISAYLKIMIEHGARIEVYSAHDYPDTVYGHRR